MNYHIRLTWSYNELNQFVIKLSDASSKCVVYEHLDQSRPHIHIWVKAITQSTDTLKNWIRNALGVQKVNKDLWTFTTLNKHGVAWDDGLITYLSKGRLEPSHNKGFTQEELDSYKSRWIDREPESGQSVSKSKHKQTSITTWFLAKELAMYIDDPTEVIQHMQNHEDYSLTQLNTEMKTITNVINKSIEIHNKYEKSYCDFSLTKVIQTAFGIAKDIRYRNMVISKVADRILPRV